MPIYGYQCDNCEHTFDVLQKISDDALVDCPDCGAPKLRKQLSAPKFRLKGKGWYETDFKDKNRRNIASSDSAKSDAGAGKDGGGAAKAEKKKSTDAAKPAGD